MNEENSRYLFETYKHFFTGKEDLRQSLMGFGFEVGDGWFEIIKSLCQNLNYHLDWDKKDGKDTISYPFTVTQVKEKFAGLRFYTHGYSNDAMEELILKAEKESRVTCEDCGKPGKYRGDRTWVRTLCLYCH